MAHRATHERLNLAVSRRQVMIGGAGLTFAFALARGAQAAVPAAENAGTALSPWVSIATDGIISIMSPAVEMGQGSMTSLPRVLAEELDADWRQVRVVPAPPIEKIYGNPGFAGTMFTAASNAVTSYFTPLRIFGAQVRQMLLDSAAKHWDVPVGELRTEPSAVVHEKSKRRLSYGEIAALRRAAGKSARDQTGETEKAG